MKLLKPGQSRYQCEAIIQPGEFVIDLWDGEQCSQTNPTHLAKCEYCGKLYCLTYHWHKHIDMEAKKDGKD